MGFILLAWSSHRKVILASLTTVFAFTCYPSPPTSLSGAVLDGPFQHYSAGLNAGMHDYYFLSQQTWQEAEAEAVSLGGHLVTVNDAQEQDWLFNTFSRQPEYGHSHQGQPGDYAIHIGFTDRDVEGQWQWVSGEPVTYTNWNPYSGEPNDVGPGGEDFAHIQDGWEYGNHWADGDADVIGTDGHYLYAIAEVVPEPRSLVLVFSFILSLSFFFLLQRSRFAGRRQS